MSTREKDGSKLSRRGFLRMSAIGAGGAMLAACAPQIVEKEVVVEKPVVQTVIVEKPVDQVVKETVVVEKVVEKVVTATPKPVHLRMWHYWTPPREEVLLGVIKKFEEKYPGIEVDCQLVAQAGKHERNLAAIASGDPPDMIMIWNSGIGSYIDNGALTPIDRYFRRDGLTDDMWIPTTFTGGYYKNNLWTLPIIAGGDRGMWYHTDQWEEVGLDPSKPPTTWAELEEYAAALNIIKDGEFERMGFYPVARAGNLKGGDGWIRYMYASYNCWPAWPCDGKTIVYDENWQEATQWAVDFTDKHCGGFEKGQDFQAFALGGSAEPGTVWLSKRQNMTLDGPWMFSLCDKQPELKWDIFPLPYGPSYTPECELCNSSYTWSWALPSGLKHPDEAWLLMKWMSAEEGNIEFTKGMKRPAALIKAAEDPFWEEEMPNWSSWLKVLKNVPAAKPPTSGIQPSIPGSESERLEIEALERALRHDWTASEAAAFLTEEMQKLYDAWWEENGI